MEHPGIRIDRLPPVESPVFIIGFDGWGNALQVATDTIGYLVDRLVAEPFGEVLPDPFYLFAQSRPEVTIENGVLRRLSAPGGRLHAVVGATGSTDLVLLKVDEPSLGWYRFTGELLSLYQQLHGRLLVTLGSMFDNVLHTDRLISGMAAGEPMRSRLLQEDVALISYSGPSAVHGVLQQEAARLGIDAISLWCHCPHYLQGTSHFGLQSTLGSLLARIGAFALDTDPLELQWLALNEKIQELIETKPELRAMINALRKEKVRGSLAGMKTAVGKDDKVINIKDFL
jgi:proteasome assembly chaperone (PAC2) family protein